MAADGTYRVILTGQLAGQFVQNVLHADCATTSGTAAVVAGDLLDSIETDFLPSWFAALPDEYSGLTYSAELIHPGTGPRIFSNASFGGVTGGLTGGILDSGNAPVITMSANNATRVITGKIFLPGIGPTQLISNVYQAGFITAISAVTGALLTGGAITGGGTYKWVVWSKKDTMSYTPTAIQLSYNPGTQRRRMRPLT